jgi:hypothetical protein
VRMHDNLLDTTAAAINQQPPDRPNGFAIVIKYEPVDHSVGFDPFTSGLRMQVRHPLQGASHTARRHHAW